MATAIPRLLPFASWDEWLSVKNGLFSDDLVANLTALDMVSLWRIRGKLPHSPDSTAHLIQIRLNDKTNFGFQYNSDSLAKVRTDSELQLLYSIAILRAVNGLVDPSQQGIFATSVMTLAEKIGLPAWIVELRHDATHNNIPSLSVLRAAANALIDWYHDFYWLPQLSLLQMLSKESLPIEQLDSHVALSNCPDVSLTYLVEFFSPIFLTDILSAFNTGKSRTWDDSQFTSMQCQQWCSRLNKIMQQSSGSYSRHILLCSLLSAVNVICLRLADIDAAAFININGVNDNESEVDGTKLACCGELRIVEFWIKQITSNNYHNKGISRGNKICDFIVTIMNNTVTVISKLPHSILDQICPMITLIFKAVSYNYRIEKESCQADIAVTISSPLVSGSCSNSCSSLTLHPLEGLKWLVNSLITVKSNHADLEDERIYDAATLSTLPEPMHCNGKRSAVLMEPSSSMVANQHTKRRKNEINSFPSDSNFVLNRSSAELNPKTLCVDYPVWPIGYLPGEYNIGYLNLIEEVT